MSFPATLTVRTIAMIVAAVTRATGILARFLAIGAVLTRTTVSTGVTPVTCALYPVFTTAACEMLTTVFTLAALWAQGVLLG